ncbi:MAG: FAD-dependent oxidoreductase, partial [Mogibacterium sp.]|nr:FAD-dependent oxidoreductase [Mogibacterium sp.]
MELATFYAELGIKVSVIEALDQLLTIVDKEFGAKLRNVLKKQGVDVFVKSAVQKIEKTDEGLTCFFEMKGKEQSVTSEYVLVAAGR